MKNILKENERIDDLEYKDLKIIQNKEGFCFGMDSVLLSDFAKEIKEGSKVVDLGTGTGILGILLCAKTKLSKIVGVEIQKDVADMAKRSVILNQLGEKFEIINQDIKELELKKGDYDAVVMNPPYKGLDTGLTSEEERKLISRHEITASLEDFIKTASDLIKQNGEIYIVHRPERLVDLIFLLRKYHLEPKKMRFVYSKINKQPKLFLIKAIKNAKPFLKISEPLIIYKEDGSYTKELLEIYHKYEKGD